MGFGGLLEVEMWKKCMPLWREAHFELKMYKNIWGSKQHFDVSMAIRCRKSARSCGASHIWKSKVLKTIKN